MSGQSSNGYLQLTSPRPIVPGSYHFGPGSAFGFDYAHDGHGWNTVTGVARILQVNIGSNGNELQFAMSFVFRGDGGTTPVYGAIGYDTPLAMAVPAETAKDRLGDFDGDGLTDMAVWRPSTGEWYIHGLTPVQWGRSGDRPVPGDYNGDGLTDIAVYRPSTGYWYVRGEPAKWWGRPGDIPVPGDYDGDGKTDIAVYRPSTGAWLVRGGSTTMYGAPGYVPAASDYTGDGATDIAVFHAGVTHIRYHHPITLGAVGDVPIPAYYPYYYGGDQPYYNDGRSVVALYHPATSTFLIDDDPSLRFGRSGDVPVSGRWNDGHPSDYRNFPGVFRPSTGTWYLDTPYGVESFRWGRQGDVPV